MRDILRRVAGSPEHPGLAYGAWAPIDAEGKVADKDRQDWLGRIAQCQPAPAYYAAAYARWEESVSHCHRRVAKTEASLFLGAGLPSAIDVGLQFHRTYGMPYLPGSALKGLLSHYLDANYGPDGERRNPRDPGHPDPERARFQAPIHGSKAMPAGDLHAAIFGEPDTGNFAARRGSIVFLDALPKPTERPMLQVDVLTVHQRSYYGKAGRVTANDFDQPNPVSFLTVGKGTEFLLAIDGEPDLAKFALELLVEALEQWGVGAKTSSGYGRLMANHPIPRQVASKARDTLDRLLTDLNQLLPQERTADALKSVLSEHVIDRLGLQRLEGEERSSMEQRIYSWLAKESGASQKARDKLRAWLKDELARAWPTTGG